MIDLAIIVLPLCIVTVYCLLLIMGYSISEFRDCLDMESIIQYIIMFISIAVLLAVAHYSVFELLGFMGEPK